MSDRADDVLAAATAALRDRAGAEAPVVTTERRVLAHFERPRRRPRVGAAVFAFALGSGTLAWAAASGKVTATLERLGVTSTRAPLAPILAGPAPTTRPRPRPATPPAIAPPLEPPPAIAPPLEPPAAPPIVPAPAPTARPRPPAPDRELAAYRRAHRVHFDGADATAAIAAWDQYLAAHPRGRFAAEARYNRALALARGGRVAEARAALAPFAAGEVLDGYRQREATELRAALAEP